MSGLPRQAKQALQREALYLQRGEEFPCKETRRLNAVVATKFMPGAKSGGTWSKTQSWLQKFYVFARGICAKSGKSRTDLQCLASNTMCRHFITHIAEEGKGFTRPRSARTVLSAERQRRGWVSLSEDRSISAVVHGAEAAAPRTLKQSAGITATMVRLINAHWGRSPLWWKRQIATVLSVGFVSIMRLGELCRLLRSAVRVVFKDGSEAYLQRLSVLPKATELKGMLLHLPWRKNHTTRDCWVPVACVQSMGLLLRQFRELRKRRCDSRYVFPSRRGRRMNDNNHVSQQSVVKAMRHALTECVPLMTRPWAKCYSGHALRVGGSNHMRRLGVEDDIHRRMGGWMTLVAAQGYMALTPSEQFKYTVALAKSKKRRAGLSMHQARGALVRGRTTALG